MKKVIAQMALTIAFTTIVFAQAKSKGLPEGIAAAFSGQYTGMTIKSWKHKGDNYILTYKDAGKKHDAIYTDGGLWLRTETSYWLTNGLPKTVQQGWKDGDYKAWIVEAIKKHESNDGTFYVLRVTNSWTYDGGEHGDEKLTYDLYYNESGELVKKIDRPFGSARL